MIKKNLTITTLVVLILMSCKEHKKNEINTTEITIETSNLVESNELLTGTYIGEIPCADCSGITKKLTLKIDNTFIMESIYNGRADGQSFIENGTFNVENKKLILTLKDTPSMYKIGMGYIEQLDMDGKQIQSSLNYKLTKL